MKTNKKFQYPSETQRIKPAGRNGKFTKAQFVPGVYFVAGAYDGLSPFDAGPCSPPGKWYFLVTVNADGTGKWNNLDGKEVYRWTGDHDGDYADWMLANEYGNGAGDDIYRIA